MKRFSFNLVYLIVICCTLIMVTCCTSSSHNHGTELLSVVAISRHGIRSQTVSMAVYNQFTLRPEGFPLWPAPADVPGQLSTWGQQSATRLGVWYRNFYASQGLLPAAGTCPAAGTVYVYADVDERTIQTAQGYLDGLFQSEAAADCGVTVKSSSAATDPIFAALKAGTCKVDTAIDQASFNIATGGNPASLTTTYAAQLQMVQTVTQCCQPALCTKYSLPSPCTLLDLPSVVVADSTTGALEFAPLFEIAEDVPEMFEMEYAQGMPETGCATTSGAQCVGWGVIPSGGLRDMTKLHTAYFDLMFRLPSYAGADGSNLLWQLIGGMDQTINGAKQAGILPHATSKLTLFVGHDDNITAIAALLGGVTWQAEGYQMDDPGPAGALVFELHKVKQSGQLIVRLFYIIATLDQMRNGTTLSLNRPPQRIPLRIPACDGRYDCPYDQFKTFITANVRQECLIK